MRVRIAVAVMAALLALYLVFAIRYGLLLIGVGEPIGIALGVALLVFPVLAAGAHRRRAGVHGARRPARAAARGRGRAPGEQLAQRPSGRIDRAAADAVFPRYKQDAEDHPEDWRAWYRLGLAYDASGDRRRARWATRKAITLARGPSRSARPERRVRDRRVLPGEAVGLKARRNDACVVQQQPRPRLAEQPSRRTPAPGAGAGAA